MSMRIISRNIQSHEERVDTDNEEKKDPTKSAEVEEAKEAAKVTEATKVVEATEVSEAIEAVEATEKEEVAGATEVIEETEVAEAAKVVEVTETSETFEAAGKRQETAEVEEIKEADEITEATVVKEAKEAKEVKEIERADPVDYEALGLRSAELNPNDYPDEVIALLEPYKNNENNNSVLFYSSLGLAYKSTGRLKAAIAAYKHALKLVPSVPAPSIQYNLGIAYYYNNELHKSFSCFLNSSAQRPDHLGTEKWIKQLADELDIYKVPNTSKLQLVVNQKISVNRKKDDRESRLRMYLTQDGGCIQELSVKDKIYSYGIDSDIKRPVDYIIIDNDGDGSFDSVVNNKGKFGVPTWAYNPD